MLTRLNYTMIFFEKARRNMTISQKWMQTNTDIKGPANNNERRTSEHYYVLIASSCEWHRRASSQANISSDGQTDSSLNSIDSLISVCLTETNCFVVSRSFYNFWLYVFWLYCVGNGGNQPICS